MIYDILLNNRKEENIIEIDKRKGGIWKKRNYY